MAATASAASAASAVTSPVKTGAFFQRRDTVGQRADRAGGLIDAGAQRGDLIGHRGKIDARRLSRAEICHLFLQNGQRLGLPGQRRFDLRDGVRRPEPGQQV